jgi:hypothetical protein
VAEPGIYSPVFTAEVAELLLSLPKSRQRRVIRLAQQLAANPFVRSDYAIPDAAGRVQEHLLIEDFVFTYWLDHGVREVRITDIEDAS